MINKIGQNITFKSNNEKSNMAKGAVIGAVGAGAVGYAIKTPITSEQIAVLGVDKFKKMIGEVSKEQKLALDDICYLINRRDDCFNLVKAIINKIIFQGQNKTSVENYLKRFFEYEKITAKEPFEASISTKEDLLESIKNLKSKIPNLENKMIETKNILENLPEQATEGEKILASLNAGGSELELKSYINALEKRVIALNLIEKAKSGSISRLTALDAHLKMEKRVFIEDFSDNIAKNLPMLSDRIQKINSRIAWIKAGKFAAVGLVVGAVVGKIFSSRNEKA